MAQSTHKGFLQRKGINISFKSYFIDALSAMAFGLFASLLIGTIFKTIAEQFDVPWLLEIATYTIGATGAALGAAIAYSLNAPALVMFSSITVGIISYALGGPLGSFITVVLSTEIGKIVSKETKLDIIVTPTVTIFSGAMIANLVGPYVSKIMYAFGDIINHATDMQPLLMGILVSVVVGIVLTLPISSAALCIMLGISGIAGGAALAGCSAQMIGFAVASYKENGVSGLVAQGLGTSMLQMSNILRKPTIWLTPTLTAAITGPLATMVFKLEIASDFSVAAGMGTSGLVGPIGVISSMGSSGDVLIGILVVCFVAPAIISAFFDAIFRKLGVVKYGDMSLDL